ncbi:TetR/AcrR family transcriptional regulator C-terminal domain-containing protein [Aquihabitans sp. McL0605]|uniref:TetR/AcrR family transcriptional regulator C-terminal domain-containing protein n=1 Tax=Aquihabitans sp. McL0605 TaxID=3415671 RepID=UPI003CF73CFB
MAAAVELADEEGIESLSMRKLAQALGVEAMSLYHHVANKDELLDTMVDVVFTEVTAPEADGRWQAQVRIRCTSLREVLLRHPWAVGRLDSRRTPGMANLQHHDAVLGCLRAGGFTIRGAGLAFATVDAFVYGFVIQELALPMAPGEDTADLAAEILASVPTDSIPHLAEMAADYASRTDYQFAEEFEPGLDLILDALERTRRTR